MTSASDYFCGGSVIPNEVCVFVANDNILKATDELGLFCSLKLLLENQSVNIKILA